MNGPTAAATSDSTSSLRADSPSSPPTSPRRTPPAQSAPEQHQRGITVVHHASGLDPRELTRQSKRALYLRDPTKAIDAANRRRALILKRTVGPVDLQLLWSEQDGLCALCGDPIDRSLKWPHPMSASLDHIVPLVAGGTHEQSNLQWTHLVENLQKGATVPNPPSNAHLTEGASNAPD